MAGGINLGTVGIGVGPITGQMSFAPMAQDPFTTMLKAYGLGQYGQAQGLDALTTAKKLPFIEKTAQAELANALAQAESHRASAHMNRLNADIAQRKEEWYLANGAVTPAQREALDMKAKVQANIEMYKSMGAMLGNQQMGQSAPGEMPSYAPGYNPAQMQQNMGAPTALDEFSAPQQMSPDYVEQGTYGMPYSAQNLSQDDGQSDQYTQALTGPSSFAYLPKVSGESTFNPQQGLESAILKMIDPSAYEARLAGMTEAAKENARAWTKTNEELAAESQGASHIISALDVASPNYQALDWQERGPLLGGVHAFSKEAQEVDRVISEVVLKNLALIKGAASNADLAKVKESVLGRNLSPEAWAEAEYMTRALALRSMEKQQFMQRAQANGSSSSEADASWNRYVNENSLYDQYKAEQQELQMLGGM